MRFIDTKFEVFKNSKSNEAWILKNIKYDGAYMGNVAIKVVNNLFSYEYFFSDENKFQKIFDKSPQDMLKESFGQYPQVIKQYTDSGEVKFYTRPFWNVINNKELSSVKSDSILNSRLYLKNNLQQILDSASKVKNYSSTSSKGNRIYQLPERFDFDKRGTKKVTIDVMNILTSYKVVSPYDNIPVVFEEIVPFKK